MNGSLGPDKVVPDTEYLYGVGCAADGNCRLTGVRQVGVTGYSHGVTVPDIGNQIGTVRSVPNTNGLEQTKSGVDIADSTTVGSTTS